MTNEKAGTEDRARLLSEREGIPIDEARAIIADADKGDDGPSLAENVKHFLKSPS